MREAMCENPIHRANQAIYNRRIPSQAEREAFDCAAGIPGMQPNSGDSKQVIASLNHGFMRLPNLMQDYLCLVDITRRQQRVLNAVARKTYGFNKPTDWITANQIKTMMGYQGHYCHISADLKMLKNRKIVIQDGKKIGINPVLSDWIINRPEKTKISQCGTEFKASESSKVAPHDAFSSNFSTPKDELSMEKEVFEDTDMAQESGIEVPFFENEPELESQYADYEEYYDLGWPTFDTIYMGSEEISPKTQTSLLANKQTDEQKSKINHNSLVENILLVSLDLSKKAINDDFYSTSPKNEVVDNLEAVDNSHDSCLNSEQNMHSGTDQNKNMLPKTDLNVTENGNPMLPKTVTTKENLQKKEKDRGSIIKFPRRIVFQSAREAIPVQTIKCISQLVYFLPDKFLSSWRMRVHNLNFGNTVQPERLVTLCLKLPLETKTAFVTSMPQASQTTDGPFPPCLLVHVKKNA